MDQTLVAEDGLSKTLKCLSMYNTLCMFHACSCVSILCMYARRHACIYIYIYMYVIFFGTFEYPCFLCFCMYVHVYVYV